jgi:hypothetical protein
MVGRIYPIFAVCTALELFGSIHTFSRYTRRTIASVRGENPKNRARNLNLGVGAKQLYDTDVFHLGCHKVPDTCSICSALGGRAKRDFASTRIISEKYKPVWFCWHHRRSKAETRYLGIREREVGLRNCIGKG